MPGRQGQRPEYQEAGSGGRRPSGCMGGGALSAQGTSVLKHPRLCLRRRTPSLRSHGLFQRHRQGGRSGDTVTQGRVIAAEKSEGQGWRQHTVMEKQWATHAELRRAERRPRREPEQLETKLMTRLWLLTRLTCRACSPGRLAAAPGCSW